MVDRVAPTRVLVGHPRSKAIYVVASTLEREVTEHVIERAVLQHQYDDVLDPLETAAHGIRHRTPRCLAASMP
jgi:hypothetical protein